MRTLVKFAAVLFITYAVVAASPTDQIAKYQGAAARAAAETNSLLPRCESFYYCSVFRKTSCERGVTKCLHVWTTRATIGRTIML